MKYAILFLAFCFSSALPAQTLISIEHSCSFDGEEEQTDFYTFDASKEADRIVGEILNSVNLAKNFVVKSADCKNALATTEGRQRYILYNTTFLEKFKQTGKVRWGAYCVLAHEIGHHLNNDDFTISDSQKRKVLELQADKFAGGVLYNLGASLEEAQAGIEALQTTGESNTHPPARARAEAMASGWKNAQEVHRQRAERDGEQPEDTTPPKNTNQPAKSEPQGKDSGAKLPDIEKKPPTQPQVDQTAVSDQLFRNALVGQWEATYSDGYSNINNIVTLNANGTGVGYLYMNGILANTVYVSWQVQRGYYMEQYAGTQYYSTLAIAFNGNNYMSLTMAETNMPNGLPVGTVLYYTRRY